MDGTADVTSETVPLTFACGAARLVGLLHLPARAKPRGVVIVVGAPQYRAGSHRQFVLLARALADAGFPVLRFDYRGMGDSDGDFVGFEDIGEDIGAALDTLFDRVPDMREVILWGLCDGASAAALYAARDPRVSGLVILNPWVRTEESLARARLTGYYVARLMSGAFWAKALGGKLDVRGSLCELGGAVTKVLVGRRTSAEATDATPASNAATVGGARLPDRIGAALRRFEKPTLVILSGADLTGREFRETVAQSKRMWDWMKRPDVQIRTLEGANHTYARRAWREQVYAWTIEWLQAQ